MSMIGIELSTVFRSETREARISLLWAVWRAELLSLACYLAGLVALFLAIPREAVGAVPGILEAMVAIGHAAGLSSLVLPSGILLCLSVVGAAFAWFGAASRIAWVASRDSLATWFHRLHPRFVAPAGLVIAQGLVSSIVLAMSFAGSGIGEVYLILLDLTVVLQLVPYLTIFMSLGRSARTRVGLQGWGMMAAGLSGAGACLAGILASFVPSREVISIWAYEMSLLVGLSFIGCLGYLAYRLSRSSRRLSAPDGPVRHPALDEPAAWVAMPTEPRH